MNLFYHKDKRQGRKRPLNEFYRIRIITVSRTSEEAGREAGRPILMRMNKRVYETREYAMNKYNIEGT